MFWKAYQKYNININRKSESLGNFGCPKGVLKSELFSQGTYHSQNFRDETSGFSQGRLHMGGGGGKVQGDKALMEGGLMRGT